MPVLTRQYQGLNLTAMEVEGGWVVSVDADPIFETMRFDDIEDAFEDARNWIDSGAPVGLMNPVVSP